MTKFEALFFQTNNTSGDLSGKQIQDKRAKSKYSRAGFSISSKAPHPEEYAQLEVISFTLHACILFPYLYSLEILSIVICVKVMTTQYVSTKETKVGSPHL